MNTPTHLPAPAPQRLSRATLGEVPAAVKRPLFEVSKLRSGILHFGCGAFHRGHQAVVTQHAIEAEGAAGLRWGIASASMNRSHTPDLLRPQDGLYTVMQRSGEEVKAEVIGALSEVLHAPSDPRGLPARLADPQTQLVTLTITANGYTLEPSSHRLQADHPHILHDLDPAVRPKSAIGNLCRGLAQVREAGARPPVIISCDNVSQNGRTLRRAVIDFAALSGDDALAAWIEGKVQFPCTMVDRIVPAAKPRDQHDAQVLLGGLVDEAPLSVEPFIAWVIESFEGDRPRWEKTGKARFVSSVEPFELAKLRLLNGTHMLLAYAGALCGHETIAGASNDPLVGPLARRFMLSEQSIGLAFSAQDLEDAVEILMRRFKNPAIRHEVSRIGRNGSVKLATRVMPPLRESLMVGGDIRGGLVLIAAWINWFAPARQGKLELIDPLAGRLKALYARHAADPQGLARAFLEQEDIFGPPLPAAVVEHLGALLAAIDERGLPRVIEEVLALPRG